MQIEDNHRAASAISNSIIKQDTQTGPTFLRFLHTPEVNHRPASERHFVQTQYQTYAAMRYTTDLERLVVELFRHETLLSRRDDALLSDGF